MTSYSTAVALCYGVMQPKSSKGLQTNDIYLFLETNQSVLALSRRRSFKNGVRHCLSSQRAFYQPESLRLWRIRPELLPRAARAYYNRAIRIRKAHQGCLSNEALVRAVMESDLTNVGLDAELLDEPVTASDHSGGSNSDNSTTSSPQPRSPHAELAIAEKKLENMRAMLAMQQQALWSAQASSWWQSTNTQGSSMPTSTAPITSFPSVTAMSSLSNLQALHQPNPLTTAAASFMGGMPGLGMGAMMPNAAAMPSNAIFNPMSMGMGPMMNMAGAGMSAIPNMRHMMTAPTMAPSLYPAAVAQASESSQLNNSASNTATALILAGLQQARS
eukprot:TRINITY_DN12558_c3_g2_i1.p1 TRINITY_DN12558_c3_g2~~TRINITY_DN12558_c3_g2_i1.p1  ORF type:complete len:331 (+),score=67.94 TRINITY_DN12558_c3_g2_i1:205-1197(+)